MLITETDYLTTIVGPAPTASFIRTTINMSAVALRRAQECHRLALLDWQAKRDAARVEYAQLVEAGKITIPTRVQHLIQTARGHPDRRDTQAARRILEKRSISWSEAA